MSRSVDVLIVGAGPSGLAAAIELRRRGAGQVLVVDRETEAGGIPRTLDHIGFGMRDLHTVVTGPAYARRYARLAAEAAVEVQLETAAVGWSGPHSLITSSPHGIEEIEAGAVVIATGCRERPRPARLVPGSRPQGVLASGALQRFASDRLPPVGRRAVVVGAENVSMADVMTLSETGVQTVALVTEHPVDQAYRWLRLFIAARYRTPVLTGTRVTDIVGLRRVEAVEVTDLATGRRRRLACDTVVFSGDWIPDHELARLGGIEIDPGTRGPRVDLAQRTSVPGVFAAGNVLHGAELGDIAALCGRFTAHSVIEYLREGFWPSEEGRIAVAYEPPIIWVTPNVVQPGDVASAGRSEPGRAWHQAAGRIGSGDVAGRLGLTGSTGFPHGHFILRVDQVLHRPRLEATQDGRVLWGKTFALLRPTLPVYAPAAWLHDVRAGAGAVTFRIGD
jgi:thioredoxin reductase